MRLTGGNPYMLRLLYIGNWSANTFTSLIIEEKRLSPEFISRWGKRLEKAVEKPDALWGTAVQYLNRTYDVSR